MSQTKAQLIDAVDGSIVTADIADGAINNAKINASAAIAGTKISPDFGSQNIATTGSITGADLEIDSGTLSVDASNNRVGIGTTSPTDTLHLVASTTDIIRVESTDAGDTGANILLYHNSASPADNDVVGVLNFRGNDSGGNQTTYAEIRSTATDVTNGTEDGILSFHNRINGSFGERMRIDASGHVGIGTTSPDQLSAGTDSTILAVIENSGTRRGQLLLGDNQNVDTGGIGDIHFVGKYQNSGHKDMACIKAQGAGSTSGQRGAVLIFETKTDGTAAIAERMRIDSTGHVGIGMTPSGVRLDVTSSVNDIARFSGPNSGGITIRNDTSHEVQIHTGNSDALIFGTNGENERMRIDSSGNKILDATFDVSSTSDRRSYFNSTGQQYHARNQHEAMIVFQAIDGTGIGSIARGTNNVLYNTSSDYRLKENVVDLTDAITRLKTLKPKRFNFKSESSITMDGFLAHEVTAVPEAITGEKDAVITQAMLDAGTLEGKVGDPVIQGIDQSKLVPLLVAAVKELITKVETLEAA